MQIRRLQKAGESSLSVTLPKTWLENLKLKDKDLIRIFPNGMYSLILQPTYINIKPVISVIDSDSLTDSMLIREIIASYISGGDEIIIKCTELKHSQRNAIRSICNNLVGFELVDETSSEMTMKNVFDPTKFPMSQNIEKMFNITTGMVIDAFKSLVRKDVPLARDIIDRDIEIDKLYLAIARQLNICISNKMTQEEFGFDHLALHYYENVATQLERISDHAVKISKIVSTDKNILGLTKHHNVKEVEATIINLLTETKTMVMKLDKNIAHSILENNREFENIIYPIGLIDKNETYIWNLLNDSFDRFRGYIMNIAEFTIDHAVAVAE